MAAALLPAALDSVLTDADWELDLILCNRSQAFVENWEGSDSRLVLSRTSAGVTTLLDLASAAGEGLLPPTPYVPVAIRVPAATMNTLPPGNYVGTVYRLFPGGAVEHAASFTLPVAQGPTTPAGTPGGVSSSEASGETLTVIKQAAGLRVLKAGGARGWPGWSPLFEIEQQGEKTAFKIADWTGEGDGVQPPVGYLAADGTLVETFGEAADLSGDDAYEVAVRNGYVGTEEEWLAALANPANEAGETVIQQINAAGLVVTGTGGTIDVKAATITADGGLLDVQAAARVVEAVGESADPGGDLYVATAGSVAQVDAAAAAAVADGGPIDLRQDVAVEAINDAITVGETLLAAASSAQVFATDGAAVAGLADGAQGWRPQAFGWAARKVERSGSALTRLYETPMPLGGPGIGAKLVQIRQREIEAQYPGPRVDKRMWHVRAVDVLENDGQAAPNRWAGAAPPTRWNMLNWTTGDIRFATGTGYTTTTGYDGAAAHVVSNSGGSVTLVGTGVAVPDDYTVRFKAYDVPGGGATSTIKGLQSDVYITPSLTVNEGALQTFTLNELTHNIDLAIVLAANSGQVFDVAIDQLELQEGGVSNLPAAYVNDFKDWHLKANIACRGALPVKTGHGGYLIADYPAFRRTFTGADVDAGADTIALAAHGLVAGDGPFAIELADPREFTMTAVDASADTLTIATHTLNTGDGPFVVSNSGGAAPGGLTAGQEVWIIRVNADLVKPAASLADAVANTPIDLTDAGSGTNKLISSLPSGPSTLTPYWVSVPDADHVKLHATRAGGLAGTGVANITASGGGILAIKTFPIVGAAMASPLGTETRFQWPAEGVTIMTFGDIRQIANDGVLWTFAYDNLISPSVLSSVGGVFVEDAGQIMTQPSQSSNRSRSWINALSVGPQLWTWQIKNGQLVLWMGRKPILHSAVAWTGIEAFARNLFRYVGARTTVPAGGQSDKYIGSDKGWSCFLTPDEVWQAIEAEEMQLAAEGNAIQPIPVFNVRCGTSIEGTIPALATRDWQLAKDRSTAPVFNFVSGANGGSGLGQVNSVVLTLTAEDTSGVFLCPGHGQATAAGPFYMRPTASAGLPGGVTGETAAYYLIDVDANHVKIATSAANANAGTFVAITSIGQMTGERWPFGFTGYADSLYGTKAVVRGAVADGSKVVVWGPSATNDAAAVIKHYDAGYSTSDAPLGPQDFVDFMTDLLAEGEAGVTTFSVLGKTVARNDGTIGPAFEVWRPTFNTDLQALAEAMTGYIAFEDIPRETSPGVFNNIEGLTLDTAAGITANSTDSLHPSSIAHGAWMQGLKALWLSIHAVLTA